MLLSPILYFLNYAEMQDKCGKMRKKMVNLSSASLLCLMSTELYNTVLDIWSGGTRAEQHGEYISSVISSIHDTIMRVSRKIFYLLSVIHVTIVTSVGSDLFLFDHTFRKLDTEASKYDNENTDILSRRIGVAFGEKDENVEDGETDSVDSAVFMKRVGEDEDSDMETNEYDEDQLAMESSYSFKVGFII